jgi:hypothetical protein
LSIAVRLLRTAGVALAAKAGLRRLVLRCAAVAALSLAALLVLLGAAAYATAALYLRLATVMPESQAALIVAAILLVLALLLAGSILLALQPRRRHGDGLAGLAALAAEAATGKGPADLRRRLARLPVTPATVVGAVALGIVVGFLTRRRGR